MHPQLAKRQLISAGIVLGAGLGGFIDGILFHQLLQVHSMLSASYPPISVVNMEVTMFWDGVFHLFTWLMTVAGIALLWRTARLRTAAELETRVFIGSLLTGWGLFNVVEGFIDHYLLGLHHVIEQLGLSVWDHGFIAFGVALIVMGYSMMRGGRATIEYTTPQHTGREWRERYGEDLRL